MTATTTELWRGAETLRMFLTPIEALVEDPDNARLHPDVNLAAIKLSLETYGQMRVAVTHEGIVRVGNGMRRAAVELGWTHLAAIEASHLTREQAIAFGLMDNKSSDLAEWDFQKVGDLLKALPGDLLDATGFPDFEREPLLQATWHPPAVGTGDEAHGRPTNMVTFYSTPEQGDVIKKAIEKVREGEGKDGKPATKEEMSDGRALELICADYLAGA